MRHDLYAAAVRMQSPEPGADRPSADQQWLTLAQQTYADSTTWLETALLRQWEINLALAQSRHPAGSKYLSELYKHRAKGFRPKIRTALRQHEAACAAAFFSTTELVSVEAGNAADEVQRAAADVLRELLTYRLGAPGRHGVRWFLNVLGAYQDAMVQGVVCSKQWWELDETRGLDRPRIDLIAPENIRLAPDADWTDPVDSSPFLIHLQPMYAGDVVERSRDPASGWIEVTLEEVLAHGQGDRTDNRTDRARQGPGRTDTREVSSGNEYTNVWVREYILRRQGRDWVFRTLGDALLLARPRPLEEVYLHGRPLVLGYCLLDSHKVYPQSVVEVLAPLQAEANEVANQRRDNVKLAMNRRYKIRRGANIDVRALLRNVPGGAIAMDDTQRDVVAEAIPDVTGSSYQEQDRINVDFDALAGTFDTGSVQSNRSLNETATGMTLINTSANNVAEYQLRVFTETWVERVLLQLVRLEQAYETDPVVLALAADRAELWARLREDQLTGDLLAREVTVRVNVGMGNTSPAQKVQRFLMGMQAAAQLPTAAARINEDEVIQELFGLLGYRDGSRFFRSAEQMQAQPPNPEAQAAQAEAQAAQAEVQIKQQELADRAQERQLRLQVELMKLAAQKEMSVADLMARLKLETDKGKLKLAETTIKETSQNQRLAAEREAEMAGYGGGGGFL